jgi:hypothetical protein
VSDFSSRTALMVLAISLADAGFINLPYLLSLFFQLLLESLEKPGKGRVSHIRCREISF